MTTDTIYTLLGAKGQIEAIENKLVKTIPEVPGTPLVPKAGQWESVQSFPGGMTPKGITSFKGSVLVLGTTTNTTSIYTNADADDSDPYALTTTLANSGFDERSTRGHIVADGTYVHVLTEEKTTKKVRIDTYDSIASDAVPVASYTGTVPDKPAGAGGLSRFMSDMATDGTKTICLDSYGELRHFDPVSKNWDTVTSVPNINGKHTRKLAGYNGVFALVTGGTTSSDPLNFGDIHISTDGGMTWRKIEGNDAELTAPNGNKPIFNHVSVTKDLIVVGGNLYADAPGKIYPGIFYSTDKGVTWDIVDQPAELAPGTPEGGVVEPYDVYAYEGGMYFSLVYDDGEHTMLFRYDIGDASPVKQTYVVTPGYYWFHGLMASGGDYERVYGADVDGKSLLISPDFTGNAGSPEKKIDRLDRIEELLAGLGGNPEEVVINSADGSKMAKISFNAANELTLKIDSNETILMDANGDFIAAGDAGATIEE